MLMLLRKHMKLLCKNAHSKKLTTIRGSTSRAWVSKEKMPIADRSPRSFYSGFLCHLWKTRKSSTMHRRYSIHRDGDVLVENLDEQGVPLEPEPVAASDRLGIEVILRCPPDDDAKAALLDLLETALGMETEGPEAVGLRPVASPNPKT
jgi:hypothetical protein